MLRLFRIEKRSKSCFFFTELLWPGITSIKDKLGDPEIFNGSKKSLSIFSDLHIGV